MGIKVLLQIDDKKNQNDLRTEEVNQPKNCVHWVVHLLSDGKGRHPYGEIQWPVGTV